MSWQTPKTDWVATDYVNYTDINRIADNLAWLRNRAIEMYRKFSITSFTNKTGYDNFIYADELNILEQNLAKINSHTYNFDIGTTKTLVDNQPVLDFNYAELNRIESACLKIKTYLDSQYAARRRLAFTLGSQKGFKV